MEIFKSQSFEVEECATETEPHSNMNNKISSLNTIIYELFDEKISTQKKTHWILGPEDLNETVVYDYEIEEAV